MFFIDLSYTTYVLVSNIYKYINILRKNITIGECKHLESIKKDL